jgi:GNAT superfamily N-acetyltransferase
MNMTPPHLFVAGVPATGKSWLGQWLAAQRGYVHVDAERDHGADFERVEVRRHWNDLVATGRARSFVAAIGEQHKPVIVNWGFPTRFLYVVAALQAEGIATWWFHAEAEVARRAFVRRGGIPVAYFDRQMADITREWLLIEAVFRPRILEALRPNGAHRSPEDLWSQMCAAGAPGAEPDPAT